MEGSNKKQVIQMVILAVLIIGMVFTTLNLMRQLRASGSRPGTTQAPKVEAKNPSATNMKPVAGSAAWDPSSTKADAALAGEVRLNPNQFRVFALSPARSPFVQEESWYAETIKEQVPGYPELKETDYFESGSLYLPKLDAILNSASNWESVSINKKIAAPEYTYKGASSDGLVDTTITLKERGEENVQVTWTPESGVPLSELTVPGWETRYPQLLQGDKAKPSGIPSDSDLLGGSPDGLSLPESAKSEGDQISCAGVSLKEGRAAALLTLNGRTFMAKQGGMVTPRYQVLEIKQDGAVLVDSRDGSSVWVPLVQGTGASVASMPKGAQPVPVPKAETPFDPLVNAFEQGMESIVDSTKKAIQDITNAYPIVP